jgi:hypothetical protein
VIEERVGRVGVGADLPDAAQETLSEVGGALAEAAAHGAELPAQRAVQLVQLAGAFTGTVEKLRLRTAPIVRQVIAAAVSLVPLEDRAVGERVVVERDDDRRGAVGRELPLEQANVGVVFQVDSLERDLQDGVDRGLESEARPAQATGRPALSEGLSPLDRQIDQAQGDRERRVVDGAPISMIGRDLEGFHEELIGEAQIGGVRNPDRHDRLATRGVRACAKRERQKRVGERATACRGGASSHDHDGAIPLRAAHQTALTPAANGVNRSL